MIGPFWSAKAFSPSILCCSFTNQRDSVRDENGTVGGGVMREQIQAGVCQAITNAIDDDFKD